MSRRLIGVAIALSLLGLCRVAAAQAPRTSGGDWLGEDRGPHLTGTIVEMWVDQKNDEATTSDPNDERRLIVQIWYPAQFDKSAERASYAQNIGLYAQWIQEGAGPVASRKTHSVFEAEMANGDERYPIVIYNPGGGSPSFSGTFQTEYLASHGYTVVSIGHTGDNGIVRFPDAYEYTPDVPDVLISDEDRESMSPVELYEWMAENTDRPKHRLIQDISFVLDQLKTLDDTPGNRFHQRLDLQRVGSLGWSLGGATSFQASIDDSRIKAAVNLDGALYGRRVAQVGTEVPILLIEGSESTGPATSGTVNPNFEELKAAQNREVWHMLGLTTADWYRATIVGADHVSFSDIYLASPVPPNVVSVHRGHAIVNALTLEFFDRYLKGNAETPLLSRTQAHSDLLLLSKAIEADN